MNDILVAAAWHCMVICWNTPPTTHTVYTQGETPEQTGDSILTLF